jgi:hypothetical protein
MAGGVHRPDLVPMMHRITYLGGSSVAHSHVIDESCLLSISFNHEHAAPHLDLLTACDAASAVVHDPETDAHCTSNDHNDHRPSSHVSLDLAPHSPETITARLLSR